MLVSIIGRRFYVGESVAVNVAGLRISFLGFFLTMLGNGPVDFVAIQFSGKLSGFLCRIGDDLLRLALWRLTLRHACLIGSVNLFNAIHAIRNVAKGKDGTNQRRITNSLFGFGGVAGWRKDDAKAASDGSPFAIANLVYRHLPVFFVDHQTNSNKTWLNNILDSCPHQTNHS